MRLTKSEAIYLLGGSSASLSRATGTHKNTVIRWPDGELSKTHECTVIGAAVRLRTWPAVPTYTQAVDVIRREIQQLEEDNDDA